MKDASNKDANDKRDSTKSAIKWNVRLQKITKAIMNEKTKGTKTTKKKRAKLILPYKHKY